MSIAPDLDKLMWSIADSGDKGAAESFQKRFPELKHELAKRMNLVQDIKKGENPLPSAPLRPEFRLKPRVNERAFRPSKRLVLVTALVLGAAVVFAASYTVFYARSSVNPNAGIGNSASLAADSCVTPATKNVVAAPQTSTTNPLVHKRVPALQTEPALPLNTKSDVQPSTSNETVPPITNPASNSKGQRIIMKQVPLSSALHAISAQYGLKIDTPPGFPDPTIDVDSEDKDAVAMLKDIGSKYGFGVVEEDNKSVLLVPQPGKP